MGAPKINLDIRLWDFFIEHGIKHQSHSYSDYEYGKTLFVKAYEKYNCDYDTFIRILINYLEI